MEDRSGRTLKQIEEEAVLRSDVMPLLLWCLEKNHTYTEGAEK